MSNEELINYYRYLQKEGKNIFLKEIGVEYLKANGIVLGNLALEDISSLSFPVEILGMLAISLLLKNGINISIKEFYYASNHFPLYTDIMKEYHQCNKRIADVLATNNEINPAKLAGSYHYLLNKGFFSYEHEFYLKNIILDGILKLVGEMMGLNVICGYGVCRNITSHFSSILKELNMERSNLYLDASDEIGNHLQQIGKTFENNKYISNTSSETNEILEEKTIYEDLKDKTIRNLFGNHVINAISFDNEAYYIDVTNRVCYSKKDKHHLTLYNASDLLEQGIAKNEYILPIKSLTNIMMGERLLMEKNKEMKNILMKETASFEEISTEFTKGQLYAEERHLQFEKLYEANLDSYQKIYSDLICCEEIITRGRTNILKKTR